MKTLTRAVTITAMYCLPVWAQQDYLCEDRPKITVNGEGVVDVEPDRIVITFGIETSDMDVLTAKQKTGEILQKAIGAIKECGVPDEGLQTDHLSVEPRWKDTYKRDEFVGYFVRTTLVVTLTNPQKVDELITRALQAGVGYIHDIDFQTTEFKKYREQARELALKAAKEKADKMAAVLGQSVGLPILIHEGYGGSVRRYSSTWSTWRGQEYRGGYGMSMARELSPATGDISESVVLGKISIRATVGVTFELKK